MVVDKLGFNHQPVELWMGIFVYPSCFQADVVKLHSELANPTELQLDGVGVDLHNLYDVFYCWQITTPTLTV